MLREGNNGKNYASGLNLVMGLSCEGENINFVTRVEVDFSTMWVAK
jgi:hypothetical protein